MNVDIFSANLKKKILKKLKRKWKQIYKEKYKPNLSFTYYQPKGNEIQILKPKIIPNQKN